MPSRIKKRGKNSYLLTVFDGYDAMKNQKVYTTTVQAENDTEAEKLYDVFKSECLQGKVLPASIRKMTLKEFYDYWKEHYSDKNLESTTKVYNDNLFARIEIVLGHLKLDKIKPKHLLDFVKQISASDAGKGDRPLSNNTIRKHCTLLKTLFNHAKRWELVTSNPMDKITPPKQEKPKKKILDEERMSGLLKILEGEPLKHQLWVLLAFSKGLRREEIFGLQWGDIDFDSNKITIARAAVYVPKSGVIIKDTKSDNSFRTLSLPTDLAMMLKLWKEELKAAVKRRNKRRKVIKFEDPTNKDNWVFPQPSGKVGHPHSFNTFLRKLRLNNSELQVSPHLLRHMAGSYLLKSGIDLATISAELGHGDKGFTMRTYIHEFQSTREQSAKTMQDILDDLKAKSAKGQA